MSQFAKLSITAAVEEHEGRFVLTGLDASDAEVLRNFLDRPALVTIEPLDTE